MFLRKKLMGKQDINQGGVPSEPAAGLPLWKRMLDLALIIAVFPGLLIIGIGAALVVICGSRGPIFFRQRRVGYQGREFNCYKFRTMQVDAEVGTHRDHFRHLMGTEVPMTKLDARKDPRLVPLGSLLRVTGLDELPQLINVLRGDMSLVGPRPCIPYEYEEYTPYQKERFDSTPGLTGLWQVSGKNRTTFDEMIRIDHRYRDELSFWLDLRIILMTVPALLIQVLDVRRARGNKAPARRTYGAVEPETPKGISITE